MTDINRHIIELLQENKSMKQISLETGMSQKQLYVRLKQIINYGYQLVPNYRYNSDIYYNIVKGIKTQNYDFSISVPKKKQNFRCIVISDLHVGNQKSDLKLLNYVYDYAVKSGINYILICGDNIEGDYTTDGKIIKDVYGQVEYLIKNYPYDPSVNNVMIFGNHDHHSIIYNGFNPASTIKNARYDIIPIGYGQGNVNLKNDSLILFHKLSEKSYPEIKSGDKIVLSGHGHLMKTKLREQLWLCIPSLSYVSVDKTKDTIPGFVDLSIDFEKGKFDYMEAKHLILAPKIIEASETRCKIKSLDNFFEEK